MAAFTPAAAQATTTNAVVSYAGHPVAIPADCKDVEVDLLIENIASGSDWSVDAQARRGDSLGGYDAGMGVASKKLPVEVCPDSVVRGIAKFDVTFELDGDGDPALGAGFQDITTQQVLEIPVLVPSKVTVRKVSSSRLIGTATAATRVARVTIWVKRAGASSFSAFGKARVAADGTWHLNRSLPYGSYKVTIPGTTSRNAASSSTLTFKKAVKKPAAPTYPAGASAVCNDGSISYSAHRQGTCSWHGGVSIWL